MGQKHFEELIERYPSSLMTMKRNDAKMSDIYQKLDWLLIQADVFVKLILSVLGMLVVCILGVLIPGILLHRLITITKERESSLVILKGKLKIVEDKKGLS